MDSPACCHDPAVFIKTLRGARDWTAALLWRQGGALHHRSHANVYTRAQTGHMHKCKHGHLITPVSTIQTLCSRCLACPDALWALLRLLHRGCPPVAKTNSVVPSLSNRWRLDLSISARATHGQRELILALPDEPGRAKTKKDTAKHPIVPAAKKLGHGEKKSSLLPPVAQPYTLLKGKIRCKQT